MHVKDILVGYTGFVGSNLVAAHGFSMCCNRKNIQESYGSKPDCLVYSGVPAEMFLANQNPEADLALMEQAIDNMRKIQPKSVVLISTIAVYPDTHGANEDTEIDISRLTAYGANRLTLERWVEQEFEHHLIVRLPAIYGLNLKKNFIYDYINYIPAMLTEEKYQQFSRQETLLADCYEKQANGFWKCIPVKGETKSNLQECFRRLGFSALNFTDSRSIYQFYHLSHLWEHIQIALSHQLKKLNITTPPISIAELYEALEHQPFVNELNKPPFDYDLRTKYDALFGGSNGYFMTKDEELNEICEFVRMMKG